MRSLGPLMIEHRLIERMIALLGRTQKRIETNHEVGPFFIDAAVDFIHMYADRTHRGKEENILFKILETKDLSVQDRLVMNEVVQEHVLGRETARELIEANTRYRKGDTSVLAAIAICLCNAGRFLSKHIAKRKTRFFSRLAWRILPGKSIRPCPMRSGSSTKGHSRKIRGGFERPEAEMSDIHRG